MLGGNNCNIIFNSREYGFSSAIFFFRFSYFLFKIVIQINNNQFPLSLSKGLAKFKITCLNSSISRIDFQVKSASK